MKNFQHLLLHFHYYIHDILLLSVYFAYVTEILELQFFINIKQLQL